jgi:recombination protein RecT
MFEDRGEPIGVYAMAKTKDGDIYFEVLTRNEIAKIKSASPSKNGPWAGDFYLEMWRKSAIKRLSKRLPKSTDLDNVIEASHEAEKVMLKPIPQEEPKQEIILEEITLPEPLSQQQQQEDIAKCEQQAEVQELFETTHQAPTVEPKVQKKKRIEDFLKDKNLGEPSEIKE